jgi:hypothetical protein
MNTLATHRRRPTKPGTRPEVRVFDLGLLRPKLVLCGCRFEKRYRLRATAVHDAHLHAFQTGHMCARPLVWAL